MNIACVLYTLHIIMRDISSILCCMWHIYHQYLTYFAVCVYYTKWMLIILAYMYRC